MNSQTKILDVLQKEPADFYHSQRGNYLTSHQLIDFIRCPFLYHKKRSGLIEEKESQTFLLGSAAHIRILEGKSVYESAFALGGPINPTTGKPYGSTTKKFAEWEELQKKPVIAYEQLELIEQMAAGVAMNSNAVELISHGIAEGVVRTEYCQTPCQIRIDWLSPDYGIVDLKTCDDLTWFEADSRRYRYHNQMAFYQAVLKQAAGKFVPVHLIAIEKKEPYRCGTWRISDDCLAAARRENESAISRLKSCYATCLWPTGYEETRVLDVI